jgi:hypothetical protein
MELDAGTSPPTTADASVIAVRIGAARVLWPATRAAADFNPDGRERGECGLCPDDATKPCHLLGERN